MNNALITLFLLLFTILGNAQINKYGYPFYKYYSLEDYNGTEQNWAIVKDPSGLLYVGNNDNGVLEYDGVHWRQIPVSNKSSVRSLATDRNGHVYVGAVGEFGLLSPDHSGLLYYKSLLPLVDSANRGNITNIWKTYSFDSVTYFCSPAKIFKYTHDTVLVIQLPDYSNFTHFVDDQMYVGQYYKGLLVYRGDTLFEPINSDRLAKTNVFVLDAVNDSLLLVGSVADGIFFLNRNDLTISDTHCPDVNAYLENNLLYHAVFNPDRIAFATLNGGILTTDGLQIKELYDNVFGLPEDQRVSYLHAEAGFKAPLWAALNNGLMRIDWHLPFRVLDSRNGLAGHVLDVLRFDNSLYVATGSGLFRLEYDEYHPNLKKILDQEIWSLDIIKGIDSGSDQMLIGTVRGLFILDENGEISSLEAQMKNLPMPDKEYYVFDMFIDYEEDRSVVLVGLIDGFAVFEYVGGKWRFRKEEIDGTEIRSVTKVGDNYWLSSNYDGVFQLDENFNVEKKYVDSDGLEINNSNLLYAHENRLFVINPKGLFQFSNEKKQFVPDTVYGDLLQVAGMGGNIIKFSKNHTYFSLFNEGTQRIMRTNIDGTYTAYDTAIFKRLPNLQFDLIYPDGDVVWLGCSKGLFAFFPNLEFNLKGQPFNSLIRKVIAKNDQLIYAGAGKTEVFGDGEQNFELSYGRNDISFVFSAPYFENEDAILYSSMLDGYDNDWSKWDKKTERVYTNLPSGRYTFKVKSKNIYGFVSEEKTFDFSSGGGESTFSFRVLPPWYQTIYAYIGYMLVLIFIIRVLVQWRTAQLIKEKEHLEELVKQRTAEIVEKKEEIEKQRDEIADKNKSITDSIQYASRIQQALLPSKKMLDDAVPDHFVLFKPRDIVSGDYYWMTHIEQKTIIVAADCTGHGVPGAFMSMLGMSFFNEIVNKNFVTDAGEILNHLRAHVIEALKQEGDDVKAKDGMDLALYVIDNKTKTINFAGANNPLYIIREQTPEEKEAIANEDETKLPKRAVFDQTHILEEVKADKMPIGIHIKNNPFQTKTIKIDTAMQLYTFSDGYVDQFGGPNRRKFMSKAFKKLLMEIHEKNMQEQKEILEKRIMEWIKEGEESQVDDIVVLGVKIS